MRWFLLAMICVPSLGCGSGFASVSGTVTLDGKPLAGKELLRGTVQFIGKDGRGAAGIGYLDEQGQYKLTTGSQKGIAPGDYLVSVSVTEIIPAKIVGDAPSGRRLTPRRFSDPTKSGFTAEVKPGRNTFDFALTSKP
jgi:hypothetical protein